MKVKEKRKKEKRDSKHPSCDQQTDRNLLYRATNRTF